MSKYTLGAYAATRNEKEVYCLSLSGTVELIEESSENFNTDNDRDLLIEVEYPKMTVESVSEFFDENAEEYTSEEKEQAIEFVKKYEEDYTTDMDVVINLLDRVLDKQARKLLYAEAAKLGISKEEIQG